MEDIIYLKTKTINKAKYGWTKYGGARHGLVKQGGQWYCQACGKEQPDSLPAFMMCVDDGNLRSFIRLCAVCENVVKKKGITKFYVLKKIVVKRSVWKKFEPIFKKNPENSG